MTPSQLQQHLQQVPPLYRAIDSLRDAYYRTEARVARATQVVGEPPPAALLTLLNTSRANVLQLNEGKADLERRGEQMHEALRDAGHRSGLGAVNWAILITAAAVLVAIAYFLLDPFVVSLARAKAIRDRAVAENVQLEAATRVWEEQARQVVPGGQLPPLPQIPGQPRQDGPGDQIAKGAGALALLAMVVGGLWIFGGNRRR